MSSLMRKTLRRKPVNRHYDSYQSFCYAVKTAVLASFERQTGGGSETQFLPHGCAKIILDDWQLSCLLRFVQPSGEKASRTRQATEDEQIRRIKCRNLQDLLALLLFISCSQTAMQAAIADLVLIDDAAWEEENEFRREESRRELGVLPLTKREAERIFGREDTVTPAFIDIHQACFCPIVFRENEATHMDDVSHRRFPYLEEEPLGEGSMGEVFRVKVAPGHFISPQGEGGDADELPRELARKDYKLNREDREEGEEERRLRGGRRIRDEKDILQLLHDCRNHGHIVKTLGAFHNGVRYSLFLELAARDLNKYLHDRNEKLTSPAAKADFLQCAADLTSALVWLHEGIKIENYDKCICYHLDLKPHNILVFLKGSGERGSGEKDMIWKLSDFGEAVLKMSTNEELTGPRKFFSFKKPNSDFSHTHNTRREGSFLAPESRNKRGMGTHSDVWSWGCIVSILFAFLEHGSQGVDEYEEIRLKDRDVKKSDQFFRPPLTWTAPKINTKVEEYHGQLIQAAESRDAVEGRAVKKFLDFLVDEVFVINFKDRTTARRMEEELRKVRDCYMRQAEGRSRDIYEPSVPLLTQAWNYVSNMVPTMLVHEEDGRVLLQFYK
jgi:serine/threonine protein kinase